jgi:hypothetical protein
MSSLETRDKTNQFEQTLPNFFLDPETDIMVQFLGPETDIICQFLDRVTDIMDEN